MRNTDDPDNKEDQDGEDRNGFRGEILTHEVLLLWQLLRFLFGRNRSDRAFNNFKPDVVRGNPQLKSVVLDRDNRSANAARRRYLVPGLQIRKHLLPLLLLLLVRPNQQQIKNSNDQDEGKKRNQAWGNRC